MEIIISAIISGLLATSITLIYTHLSQQRSFRIKTALKVVEECDKLLRVYSKLKLKFSAPTESSEDGFKDFMSMYNEFSGDVMIELAYGENEQIEKYRKFRATLFDAMDMNQPDVGRINRKEKEEERITKLKSELFNSLINDGIIYKIKTIILEIANGTKIKCSGKYKK
jgi:hypothetical protein